MTMYKKLWMGYVFFHLLAIRVQTFNPKDAAIVQKQPRNLQWLNTQNQKADIKPMSNLGSLGSLTTIDCILEKSVSKSALEVF